MAYQGYGNPGYPGFQQVSGGYSAYPNQQGNGGYSGYPNQQGSGGYTGYATAQSNGSYAGYQAQSGGSYSAYSNPSGSVGYSGYSQLGGGSGSYQQSSYGQASAMPANAQGAYGGNTSASWGWGRPPAGGSYDANYMSGAVAGFTVPFAVSAPSLTISITPVVQQAREQWGEQSQIRPPPPVPPPQSMLYGQMDAMLTAQNLQAMQWKMMKQMGIISDSDSDSDDEGHCKRAHVQQNTMGQSGYPTALATTYMPSQANVSAVAAAGPSAADVAAQQAAVDAQRATLAAEQKRVEEKAKQAAEALRQNQALKDKMRSMFIDEMLQKQAAFGTFDATSGTVQPFVKYAANDPVCQFYREAQQMDLTGKPWNPEADCQYLRKGMKGVGTNDDAIVYLVASRSNAQRQQLKIMFKSMYGRDLIEDLHSELSGDYRESIMAAFVSQAEYDAWAIKEAIYGLGTDELTLIEILMTRTNAQIQQIQKVYGDVVSPSRKVPHDQMDKDIVGDASGDFKRLLRAAAMGNRAMVSHEQLEQAVEEVVINNIPTGMFQINYAKLVDSDRCRIEAKQLFDAGEARWGTDEETFIRIFSTRNYYELRAIWAEYVKVAQRDILNSIDRETSGNFEKGLLAIVTNIRCRPLYFADRLVHAMKGLGTDDKTLIRVVISRSEIDMAQIKQCFLEQTKQTLWRWLGDDTSGHYKKLLQAIVKPD